MTCRIRVLGFGHGLQDQHAVGDDHRRATVGVGTRPVFTEGSVLMAEGAALGPCGFVPLVDDGVIVESNKAVPTITVPSTVELSVKIRISVCSRLKRWFRDRLLCFCTGKALSTGLRGVFAGGG